MSFTGCPGSSWQIAGGYLRQKTWIDFQSNGIFIIEKVGNFIWHHKNSEKNLTRHSKYKTTENGNFKIGNLAFTQILSAL